MKRHRGKAHLRISKEGDGDSLRVSFYQGENPALRRYEIIPFDKKKVEAICSQVTEKLNRVPVDKNILKYLRQRGAELSDLLLTETIRDNLKKCESDNLIFDLDDYVVHIHWELLCIERELLCRSFNVGRTVQTRQTTPGNHGKTYELSKILIIVDPTGDLQAAETEGKAVQEIAEKYNKEVTLRKDVTIEDIQDIITEYDIVHFAGHADYYPENLSKNGWKLADGTLDAEAIRAMKYSEMPYLIFSNACESASGRWDESSIATFGLANAFLVEGVHHYIGTLWKVQDTHSSQFAVRFYENLFSGKSIGESLRCSRTSVVRGGDANACCTSYVLYGDPTTEYEQKSIWEIIRDWIVDNILKDYGNYLLVALIAAILTFAIMVYRNYDNRPTIGVEISVAFFPYLSQGKDFFIATVIEKEILEHRQCITLIDRLTIDKIIQNQKLNGYLLNLWYKIRPLILPANYLLYLSVDKSSEQEYVIMRVRDAKSEVKEIFHEPLESDKLILPQQERLVNGLSEYLTGFCQEQGRLEK